MNLIIVKQNDSFNFYLNKNNFDEYVGNLKYIVTRNILFIVNYYIIPIFRKKHLSDQVFEYLFNFCKENKIKKIELVAKELFSNFNKLVNFYKKYGFEIDDDRQIYIKWYEGDMFRFVSMIKNI